MDGSALPEGKLPAAVLERLLERFGAAAGVELGPALGEDAAVASLAGEPRLVMAADPITFPSPDPGWHAVIVNANDVAATGGAPRWFLSSVIAPPGTDEAWLARVAGGIARGCEEVGAAPVGGHTEISASVSTPVVAGTMIGTATPERIKPSGDAREGDMIVITKGIAIEATAVVTGAEGDAVEARFGRGFRERAEAFLRDPGISVAAEAEVAAGVLGVRAMHDVTEGGLATALHEMADCAGLGVVVADTEIPRFQESKFLMEHFRLDILGAIGSGALLIACSEPETADLLDRLGEAGCPGHVIGRFTQRSSGAVLVRGSARRPLPRFPADEVTRIV